MSGISLTADLTGKAQIVRLLRALELRADNLTPAMDEIGSMLVASVGDRFAKTAGPDGTPWEKSRRARKDSGVTLTDSGRLRQSITHTAGPATVEIGTNLIYAAIHQFGGTITKHAASRQIHRRQSDLDRGVSRFVKREEADVSSWHEVGEHAITMPARPFLGLSPADETEIAAILRDYLTAL